MLRPTAGRSLVKSRKCHSAAVLSFDGAICRNAWLSTGYPLDCIQLGDQRGPCSESFLFGALNLFFEFNYHFLNSIVLRHRVQHCRGQFESQVRDDSKSAALLESLQVESSKVGTCE